MNHLDEHDSRALRLNRAMYAPLREVPIVITMDDAPPVTPESAMHLAKRLLWIAAGVAWAAVVGYALHEHWPRLAYMLGAI